jgi:uncharacterized membrane protein HdeD (DUF308 family)
MSAEPQVIYGELHLVGTDQIGKKWGWVFGLGVILLLLGLVALGSSVFVTLTTMVFVGSLMLLAGVLQTIHAVMMRTWSGFFLDLLAGVLNTVVGLLIIAHPGATAVALTLMIAILLILGGVFRIVAGLAVRYHNRLWLILHGAIALLLAYSILSDWPMSGLWVVGTFVGIDLIFNGWSLIMLGLLLRKAITR